MNIVARHYGRRAKTECSMRSLQESFHDRQETPPSQEVCELGGATVPTGRLHYSVKLLQKRSPTIQCWVGSHCHATEGRALATMEAAAMAVHLASPFTIASAAVPTIACSQSGSAQRQDVHPT